MNKIICPKCKKLSGIPIMYGMPSSEAFELEAKGEIYLGGCEIGLIKSNFHCNNCNYEWFEDIDIEDF
jgi:hypothetical protein